jgi:glucan phosphoethanolaminetransferase (alkaline phosphatase superfamily)
MNPNEKTPNTGSGSLRIQKISKILKAMILIYMVVLPLCVAISAIIAFSTGQTRSFFYVNPPVSSADKVMAAFSAAIYLLWAVTFYRLLNLYEKGIVFSSANVRLFRLMGYLAFSRGLLAVVASVVSTGQLVFPTVLFVALGSPWLVGGLFGIMVSYIMEEGCKLREEQELTV